ncbi:hypothetical protein GN244_ATG04050 [Phytophthora infestans]|uniref:Secreted RxLR effector peptide protein n=1 Tax=Phytophthora infestans TaxID=4787 RepID=A0A833TNK4_PHYIN|nr:hypothetical protein GN244_ATG04050 [Phytophthora infestans]KAF4149057.1 hypothetical protein GN958_ATG01821 [Phytophthora infestans]KAI9983165.1 hypothetical protein PInf_007092 [Phytophthora infestans]
MKPLHRLLISSACLAALTTCTPISAAAQKVGVSNSGSGCPGGTTTFLRGSDPNYDGAELYPFFDVNEDAIALIPAAAVEFKINLDDAGEEFEVELVSVTKENNAEVVPRTLNEINNDNFELVQDEDVEDTIQEEIMIEDFQSDYGRHLRSLADPAPAGQIQLPETTPPTETVTPPSDLQHSNLRGREQRNS